MFTSFCFFAQSQAALADNVITVGTFAVPQHDRAQPEDANIPDMDFAEKDDDLEEDPFAEEEISPIHDPIEPFNRFVFQINDRLYYYALKPASIVLSFLLPRKLREAVSRAFHNSQTPIRLTNCLIQGRFRDAGIELTRLTINTTFGLGGLFDPAREWWDIRARKADFGQTMGLYGIGHGFYLVIPLIGPSSLRDSIGILGDYMLLPQNYFITTYDRICIYMGEAVNYVSLHPEEYDELKKEAIDPYIFFRDVYNQYRARSVGGQQ